MGLQRCLTFDLCEVVKANILLHLFILLLLLRKVEKTGRVLEVHIAPSLKLYTLTILKIQIFHVFHLFLKLYFSVCQCIVEKNSPTAIVRNWLAWRVCVPNPILLRVFI